MSRLSTRSLLATSPFVASGMLTVALLRVWGCFSETLTATLRRALLSGAPFGTGLSSSGMTRPEKVLGSWAPSASKELAEPSYRSSAEWPAGAPDTRMKPGGKGV